jgi:hypothetical protein
MMCRYTRSNSREHLASDMAYTATRVGDPVRQPAAHNNGLDGAGR